MLNDKHSEYASCMFLRSHRPNSRMFARFRHFIFISIRFSTHITYTSRIFISWLHINMLLLLGKTPKSNMDCDVGLICAHHTKFSSHLFPYTFLLAFERFCDIWLCTCIAGYYILFKCVFHRFFYFFTYMQICAALAEAATIDLRAFMYRKREK